MMEPIFPAPVIDAGPLLLRPFGPQDIEDTQVACADELTQRWLPLPRPYDRAAAEGWCTAYSHALRESGDGLHLAVTDAHGGRLLGNVGLRRTDWQERVSEIGYWVAPHARGQGVAVAAAVALGHWLLREQGFARLELKAATGNAASRKVAERAGFQREGVLRSASSLHTGRADVVLYSLIAEDLAAV